MNHDFAVPTGEFFYHDKGLITQEDNIKISIGLLAKLLKHHGDNPPDAASRVAARRLRAVCDPAGAARLAVERLIQSDREEYESFASQSDMHRIVAEVAAKRGLKRASLFKHCRKRKVVRARQEAMARCVEETIHTLPRIGRFFGFDHSTVISSAHTFAARQRGEAPKGKLIGSLRRPAIERQSINAEGATV